MACVQVSEEVLGVPGYCQQEQSTLLSSHRARAFLHWSRLHPRTSEPGPPELFLLREYQSSGSSSAPERETELYSQLGPHLLDTHTHPPFPMLLTCPQPLEGV